MKQLSEAKFVPAHEFQVIEPTADILISKKQKYEMIYYNGSTFKRVKESILCSFINQDNTIQNVYICSRERYSCRCHFILSKDGNGRLLGNHLMSLEHSVDLYRYQRFLFKSHVNKCLCISKNELPFNIINSYLKEFEINQYSPCLNYISSCICKEKQKGLGKLPSTFSELDLNKMKEVGESFEIEHLQYMDDQEMATPNGKIFKVLYVRQYVQKCPKNVFRTSCCKHFSGSKIFSCIFRFMRI